MHKVIIAFTLFFISFINCFSQSLNKESSYQLKFKSLNTSFSDSKEKQKGFKYTFIEKWGDKYWKLAKEAPNHKVAPKASKKAFELYKKLKNPNIYNQKLNELSIHSRAMSSVLQYWENALNNGEAPTPAHPYVQKLEFIAARSKAEEVQISARYHLAKWFFKHKYHERSLKQLSILEFNYDVYSNHEVYGEGIKRIYQRAVKYSAGKEMPELSLEMLRGEPFTTKDLLNKVTFIYFYGSGCGPCTKMYPKLTKLYNRYKKEGFQVIGVADDWQVNYGFNSIEEFSQFAKKYHINWPQAVNSNLWDKLQVQALSTGYLINKKGEIVRISRSDRVTNAVEDYNTSLNKAVSLLISRL